MPPRRFFNRSRITRTVARLGETATKSKENRRGSRAGKEYLKRIVPRSCWPFHAERDQEHDWQSGNLPALAVVLLGGCAILSGCGAQADVYALPLTEAKAKISSTKASYKAGSQTRWMRSAGLAPDGLRVEVIQRGHLFVVLRRYGSRLWIPTRPASRPIAGIRARRSPMRARPFFEREIAALVRQTLTGEPVDADVLGRGKWQLFHDERPAEDAEGRLCCRRKIGSRRSRMPRSSGSRIQKAGWAD